MEKEFLQIKVADLVPYEGNPRHNAAAVPKVVASFRKCGAISPVVVDEGNVILAGHTRRLAAMEIGLDELPCVRVSGLTEAQKRAFRLADNKTAEFAEWDMQKLEEELDAIAGLGFDMEDIGFQPVGGDDAESADEAPARITSPLDEDHEYVLIVCDNNIDWEQAKTVFDLGQREAFRANRKDSGQKPIRCFSHVVPWKEFAKRFLDEDR